MYTPSQIKTCFKNLIGFPQYYGKDFDKLDIDLLGSDSGIMIDQSAHPLITLENIAAVANYFLSDTIQAYSSLKTYAIGDIVYDSTGENTSIIGSNVFVSLMNGNINHLPNSSSAQWQKTNLISIYLKRVLEGAAINLFNTVFTQKKLFEVAKTLLTDTSLYEGVGNLQKTVIKYGRFVGYRLTTKAQDTTINISTIGMQFTQANPTFKLYVYHTSQLAPLKIITIAHDKVISFTWKTLSEALLLPYVDDVIDRGGSYYIGYYEDDLVGNAIWKEVNFFSQQGCSTCNPTNMILYKQWRPFLSLQPFYVDAGNLDPDRNMFDTWKVVNIANQNYGLNFRFKVQCDVSTLICNNRLIFGNAYKVQVVHDLLNEMAYSMRDNQLKQKVSQMAFYALENKDNFTKGVKKDLEEAVKVISFDMSGLSKVCLPCNANAGGIELSSVYR